jgi:hypothetical protein
LNWSESTVYMWMWPNCPAKNKAQFVAELFNDQRYKKETEMFNWSNYIPPSELCLETNFLDPFFERLSLACEYASTKKTDERGVFVLGLKSLCLILYTYMQ